MSLQVRNLPDEYVRPISRGQITIPKRYREAYDIDQTTWLKVVGGRNRILLYPQNQTVVKKSKLVDYRRKVKKINGSWWTNRDEQLRLKGRKQAEDRLKQLWQE